ncbi:MAG: ROK family protein [Candidatus Omnitrophica bacterium]|nr:ROK family protein [Candidatus Omnitrophota bacterium]
MKYAIGIDIGGTKISIVLGNRRGKILACQTLPTQKGVLAEQSVRDILQHLDYLVREESTLKWSQITGIGIGIPGPVNSKRGIVPKSPHMTGWTGIPLRRIVKQHCHIPVFMMNDANAAALGEQMFGDGKRERHFVYLTISTGIGGGLIANGKLIEGESYTAGEVGHMKIVAQGRRCKCGKYGCLEAYASGTAIAEAAREAIRKGKKSKIPSFVPNGKPFSAKEVGLAAKKGDGLALEIFREAGFHLGIGISNLLHLINPGMIVLGGGVWKSSPPIFWKAMMQSVKKASWPTAFKVVKIQHSVLKDRIGDLGALAVVFENVD